MANETIKKSTRIERARQRLDGAVDRLEAVLKDGAAADLRRDVGALKQENAALRETTEVVAQRLDGAINRMKTALEE